MPEPVNIVIPVKGLREGKSRLADALSAEQRTALNTYLTKRTLDVVAETMSGAKIVVVSPDPEIQDLASSVEADFLEQADSGLNAGLVEAVAALPQVRTAIVAADLPQLTTEDVAYLLAVSGVGIAPDESGLGTNALSLPAPNSIAFRFGAGSFDAHSAGAGNTGTPIEIVRRPGLAFDLDTKHDLSRLKGWP